VDMKVSIVSATS